MSRLLVSTNAAASTADEDISLRSIGVARLYNRDLRTSMTQFENDTSAKLKIEHELAGAVHSNLAFAILSSKRESCGEPAADFGT
jgi:hypothetical protein